MSAETLNLKNEFEINEFPRINTLKAYVNSYDVVQLKISNGRSMGGEKKYAYYVLDRDQAHLLMLYLQERLECNAINKNSK